MRRQDGGRGIVSRERGSRGGGNVHGHVFRRIINLQPSSTPETMAMICNDDDGNTPRGRGLY